MKRFPPDGFKYPTTRYTGSKRRLLEWIWENVSGIQFDSVLDLFGGSGSTSLLFKRHGKKVHYNDLLKFNQIIGSAIVENSGTTVTADDIEGVLVHETASGPGFIEQTFEGIYFTTDENRWLDIVTSRIQAVEDQYKKAIMLAGLFQACLAKRPFNMFHRANLYIRTADVGRSFGNKTTWERPFAELFRRYVEEYNSAVFSNGRPNKVIGGFDALESPNGVDMVYIDPPYLRRRWSEGTNYLAKYHFLEGLAQYSDWGARIDKKSKTKTLKDSQGANRFLNKTNASTAFFELIDRFADNILVISYRADGYPSEDQIVCKLESMGKDVRIHRRPLRYALSGAISDELLFVAT